MQRLYSLLLVTLLVLMAFALSAFSQDSLNVRRLARMGTYAYDVAISGDRAYVCGWAFGLTLVDISQLDTLVNLGTYFPPC